ncbi:MAG: hypothetical protein RLZZ219_1266 [Cyanobacteriota bacterium]|jgi:hypothetical protein
MNSQHCQTCSHWDQTHGLEMTSLGAIAPCTRHAPSQVRFETVELTGAALNFATNPATHALSEMQIPMAVWPYTSRNQICGEYQPCDLEESARRTRLRSAPIA